LQGPPLGDHQIDEEWGKKYREMTERSFKEMMVSI